MEINDLSNKNVLISKCDICNNERSKVVIFGVDNYHVCFGCLENFINYELQKQLFVNIVKDITDFNSECYICNRENVDVVNCCRFPNSDIPICKNCLELILKEIN
nr:MAG: hypothetical protein [Microvirus Sku218]